MRARRLFKALVKASGSVVWRLDIDGFVEALEPAELAAHMEHWRGHGWREAIHPHDLQRVLDSWSAAAADKTPVQVKFRALKDDEFRWFRAYGTRIEGSTGAHWVGVVRDIHLEVLAQVELERSELLYRALVEASAALVWRASADGKMTEARGWASYQSYRGDEWLTAIHGQDREEAAARWRAIVASAAHGEISFRARTDSGEHRWCVARAVPIKDQAGQVLEWVGTLTDVHDQKLALEETQRSERMRSIGRLTSGIAHDFNNLLTVITAGAETLLDDAVVQQGANGEQAELILQASLKGAELVRQLLSFSRRQPLRPGSICVADLMQFLEPLIRRTIGEDIELVTRSSNLDICCLADPALLDAAILNLCINARDAMPDGGRLTIEADETELRRGAATDLGLTPGRFLVLTVRDEGVGMTPNELEHAIEPFFTTKEVGKGSGLGLSTVYGFARQSGGHMTIASAPGEGCVVQLFIPSAEKTEPVRQAPKTAPPAAAFGAHLLLVEDEALVRQQFAHQLAALGFRVTATGHAAEALEALASNEAFELLITDVVMPGMNGRQLAEHAALLRPQLPVLFTSGHTDDAVLRKTGRLSTNFLRKPFGRRELARAVDMAIASGLAAPRRAVGF